MEAVFLECRKIIVSLCPILDKTVTIEDLCGHIRHHFGFVPTTEQENALQTFSRFMFDREKHTLMILRGCAGTGKTSLAGAFVRTMMKLGQKVVLMAPTGRAAKVFSLNSGSPASTIHRKIYRQKGIIGGFALDINLHKNTLFIVDEASMIANDGMMESVFGSGRLLDDMMQYVYEGDNCRLLIIGDKAQLPPVGEEESPALSKDYMRGYGMNVYEADLNEVLRQEQESGILYNATMIRQMITHDELTQMPKVVFKGFADIRMVPGNELIESLNSSYSQVGMDETMVVTRSNKRANIYNMGIRNSILGREEQLTTGDLLMIVKNNYFWTAKDSDPASRQIQFLANGDRACVRRVRNIRSLYGFSFADVWLQLPDYDDYEIQATIIMDSLLTEAPALTREQSNILFNNVLEDYADIPTKPERMKRLREDMYYNSLQVKYAYAVTCHKAQGGQWAHIYIDQGYMTDDMLTPDYIHWLYTAFTRATEKLYLVNWPV